MSSQTASIQYMYIPNLVGRQMLRVPVLPCEEQTLQTTPALSLNTTSEPMKDTYSREASPSPSVSVEEVSEEE